MSIDDLFRQTMAVETCPSCGRRQHALIAKLDSRGRIEKFKCKSCGILFSFETGKQVVTDAELQRRKERRKEYARRYYQEHKEEIKAKRHEPKTQERLREWHRDNYLLHREEILKRKKQYYQDRKESMSAEEKAEFDKRNRANAKAYNARHPDRIKAKKYRRYLRLINDESDQLHGTYSGYVTGCRCDRCKQGYRDYEEKRKSA